VTSVVFFRGRLAALPGILIGVFLIAFALVGGRLWNWSRDMNGAGFPYSIPADENLFSTSSTIFASAASGAVAAACLIALVLRDRFNAAEVKRNLESRRVQLGAQGLSGFILVLWFVGQGPSVWARVEYLRTDGIEWVLRSVSLLGPLAGVCAFTIAFFAKKRGPRFIGIGLGCVWWVVTVSVGTRMSVAFVLVAIGVLLISAISSRNVKYLFLFVLGLPILSYLALATFAVTLVARGEPHGVSRFFDLFGNINVPQFWNVDTWMRPLKWLTSSISSAVPLTEQSALHGAPGSILVANLNPLPSGLIEVDGYSFERLWPYFWVPLGFLGEWYGAFGVGGVVALAAFISLAAGAGAVAMQRAGMHVITVLLMVLVLALCFIMIQYPSRSTGRPLSFVLLLPVGLLMLRNFIRVVAPEKATDRAPQIRRNHTTSKLAYKAQNW